MNYPQGTAAQQKLACCHVCHTIVDTQAHTHCSFCRNSVHLRRPGSIQKSLAYLFTSVVFYIPANAFPIMNTTTLGQVESHTIAEGVVTFWKAGDYPIALVIFVASIMIPVAKMIAISWLCWFSTGSRKANQRQLTRVYRVTELIGKWSMIDVFVVTLMVALVQMGSLMSISPGPAAITFAAVVVFTMLSAHALDTRNIWDKDQL